MKNSISAAISELGRLLAQVGVVGQISGYDVVRRESILELVDRRVYEYANQPANSATPDPAAPLVDAELAELQSSYGEFAQKVREAAEWEAAHPQGVPNRYSVDGSVYVAQVGGLLARLAAAEAPRWVAVHERLPETSDLVLIARPARPNFWNTIATGYFDNGSWYAKHEDYDGDDLLDNSVTHWQPLPAAPTANAGKEPGSC